MPLLAWYGYSIQLLAGEVHGCIHERGCWPTLPPCHRLCFLAAMNCLSQRHLFGMMVVSTSVAERSLLMTQSINSTQLQNTFWRFFGPSLFQSLRSMMFARRALIWVGCGDVVLQRNVPTQIQCWARSFTLCRTWQLTFCSTEFSLWPVLHVFPFNVVSFFSPTLRFARKRMACTTSWSILSAAYHRAPLTG